MNPALSIVLPCYNEAKGLGKLLARYDQVLQGVDAEVILVDNGSKDNTQEVMALELPKYPWARCFQVVQNKGYGDGILQGLRQARGEWLAWSHADLQTDGADVVSAWRAQQAQANPQRVLVKGHRHGRAMGEQVITIGMQIFALFALRRWLSEINAQPKVFHRSLLDHLVDPPPDFNFDVYTLCKARQNGWKIITIPVQFPPRQHGTSNWSASWKSKIRTIRRSMWFMIRLGFGAVK